MKIAAIPILLILLLALPIACDALNPAPTATPIPPPTIAPATAPNPEPASTVTPAPTHTPQPAPTATPVPTATPAPTATPQPTPTSRPTATPRPRPTPTRRPTATPAPRLESRTEIIVPAGETRSYQVRVPADGYLYYSFTSVEHLNESEALDIDFKIFGPLFDYFQGNDITSFAANQPVEKDHFYRFGFDNTGSLFAGKLVRLHYRWSLTPLGNAPVIPGYGQHAGTELCQQARQNQVDGNYDLMAEAITLAPGLIAGEPTSWTYLTVRLVTEIFSGNEANTAGNAILAWGCGTS